MMTTHDPGREAGDEAPAAALWTWLALALAVLAAAVALDALVEGSGRRALTGLLLGAAAFAGGVVLRLLAPAGLGGPAQM